MEKVGLFFFFLNSTGPSLPYCVQHHGPSLPSRAQQPGPSLPSRAQHPGPSLPSRTQQPGPSLPSCVQECEGEGVDNRYPSPKTVKAVIRR